MNRIGLKFLLITCLFLAVFTASAADFTLALIEPFFPGNSVEKIKSDKTIQSDIFEDNGNQKILKLKLKSANPKLDIFLQTKDDKVTDLFVRLPQHLSHDSVLAELQKKYKKQESFSRKDRSALYKWMNKDGNNIIYNGICSITCFPMFIEVVSTDKTVTPLSQKFNDATPKW
jgi:hypothetical protein